jgi:hypothetical protein
MSISLRFNLALFADDSALVYSGKDTDHIAEYLGQELESCRRWLIDNKLSLHWGRLNV